MLRPKNCKNKNLYFPRTSDFSVLFFLCRLKFKNASGKTSSKVRDFVSRVDAHFLRLSDIFRIRSVVENFPVSNEEGWKLDTLQANIRTAVKIPI